MKGAAASDDALAAVEQIWTERLETVNRELEDLTYSISHDLRAPVRAVSGFSQALAEEYGDKLDDQGKRYLELVQDSAKQMGELIDDLLSLSRVARGVLHPERVDLSDLAFDLSSRLKSRLENAGRKVEFVIHPGLSAEGDLHLLGIALENLIGNAWKFSAGVPAARIEVGAVEKDGERVFYVRDNGAGFDLQYAKNLFAPFQRLHALGEFEGHGIGLATAQRILHRHGGRIWAEAELGKGATFYFTVGGEGEG